MPWMGQLLRTYECNIGKSQADKQLMPQAHMNVNAQIEITLNQEGEFQAAVSVDKNDAETLVPVTEDSASRTAKLPPHPLCDTLSYLAGDFSSYCGDVKQKDDAEEKFQMYSANLNKWAESEYSHPKVRAVYQYILKKTMAYDLIQSAILELKPDGTFQDKKISGKSYDKAVVRFRIFDGGTQGDGTWEDISLIQAYTEYYLNNQKGTRDICYLTGRENVISRKHPKGIVASDYGAKLVSANDESNFIYRGRFKSAGQPYALSYDVSQKIHSTLTWLVKTHGEHAGMKDKRTFICWNPQGKKTPRIMDEFGLVQDEDMPQEETNYRRKLKKAFQGYQNQFEETDSVVVMGLDAATTGRLSVTYYQELAASDFLKRMLYWGNSCSWYFLKFDEKQKSYYTVETPVFRRIAECAYGWEIEREKGNFIEINDKVLKEQTQRLVKCMLDKEQIPFDIVHALAVRASMPMAYTGGNRERVLSTACALIRKYYMDRNGEWEEKDDMKLDLENQDRSYLFGRLLAVCEKIERSTFESGETRDTNAIRLQSAFVRHPMLTWKNLEQLLNPYFQKLAPGLREYYRNLIAKIVISFADKDESSLNHELKETYLLGYYLQRAELNRKKEDKESEEA